METNQKIQEWKRERAEAKARIDKTRAAVYELERRIYAALVDTATMLKDLARARGEYIVALRAGDSPTAGTQARVITALINRLAKGIVELLRSFPDRIVNDSDHPSPDELLKTITAKKS